MKSYKDFKKAFIGSSDIAALTLLGYDPDKGAVPHLLKFGGDNSYYAYIVDAPDVEIGEHYTLAFHFESWLRIYDDEGLTLQKSASNIDIYTAGNYGCIIHLH